jgi:DNA-binding FrmR family transcriptional regulator
MPNPSKQPKHQTDSPSEHAPGAPAHATHKDVVNRLKRADGHLKKIITMIESERACLDIAQQMQAVIRALESAKVTLIHDHIDHCLEVAVGPTTRADRVAIDDFKEITKYL